MNICVTRDPHHAVSDDSASDIMSCPVHRIISVGERTSMDALTHSRRLDETRSPNLTLESKLELIESSRASIAGVMMYGSLYCIVRTVGSIPDVRCGVLRSGNVEWLLGRVAMHVCTLTYHKAR